MAADFFGQEFFGGSFFNSGGGPTPTPGRSGLGGDDVPRKSPHKGWNRKEWQRRKDDMDAMVKTIEETYRFLRDGPQPVREEAAKIVAKQTIRIPNAEPRIDWAAIARSYERTTALIELRQREEDLRRAEEEAEEEEAILTWWLQ